METEISEIWKDAVSRLREHVSPRDLACWIATIQPCRIHGDVLVGEVPTAMHLDRVRERFLGEITSALTDARGETTRLELSVNLSQACRPTTAPRASARAFAARYTFDTFVTGSSNEMAYRSARAVASAPGARFNPLFVHGGVGLGKTHLANAIANAVAASIPADRVILVSAEAFTNELIRAFRTDRTEAFRDRFRRIDVLIVDDVQFLAGKERMQEEFYHTFNALHLTGKQIVLASDQPPQDIPNLEKRLRNRFECGLITDVRTPESSLRRAIVLRKAATWKLVLADDVIDLIAGRITSNVRELEGALQRLAAACEVCRCAPDLGFATGTLAPLFRTPEPLTLCQIQKVVADRLRVRPEELARGRRSGQVALPRHVAMYLARKRTAATYAEIAASFGGRNHSTVLYAVKAVEERRAQEPAFAAMLEELETKLVASP